MSRFPSERVLVLFATLVICLGCASGGVVGTNGPNISEARAVPATGPKARIAVAQFVNNSGGLEAQLQRMSARLQADMINIQRAGLELQKKMIPWQQAFMEWQAKVAAVGEEKAGPPPKMPELNVSSSSPYMATITDPVAGGVRDMMVNALLNSNRFIVLERQAIDQINWEQEFSQSGRVGEKTKLPIGQIEGAELLLIGSLTTLEAEHSGGGLEGILSEFIKSLANTPVANMELGVSWKTAKAAMEIRVIDTRTSRIVAATTVEGRSTDIGLGGRKRTGSSYYDEGKLPTSFTAIQKTPVEEAFREMVHAAVEFLITKTPENFFRITAE